MFKRLYPSDLLKRWNALSFEEQVLLASIGVAIVVLLLSVYAGLLAFIVAVAMFFLGVTYTRACHDIIESKRPKPHAFKVGGVYQIRGGDTVMIVEVKDHGYLYRTSDRRKVFVSLTGMFDPQSDRISPHDLIPGAIVPGQDPIV
jgi:hypothetical protein